MNQTEDIKELVTALSKAQGAMKPAIFDKINPHFKSRYASFTSCVEACQKPLAENGLSFMQYCEIVGEKYQLVTMLAHTSGQWIKSYFPFNPIDSKIQTLGSTLSYAKRYSLCALLGIVSDDDDDDGNAADNLNKNNLQQQKEHHFKISQEKLDFLAFCESRLNDESKDKIRKWIKNNYKIEDLKDLLEKDYQQVVICYDNAIKKLEQEKRENNENS